MGLLGKPTILGNPQFDHGWGLLKARGFLEVTFTFLFWKTTGNYDGNMGVSPKIEGKTPKWMVKIMENPLKMDDLGGKPTIFRNTHMKIFPKIVDFNFGRVLQLGPAHWVV